jgi:aspartate/methionine/tyrosine aminotransferase
MVLTFDFRKSLVPRHRYSFWEELAFVKPESFKFLPYGSASIELPEFYRDIISEVVQKAPISDFQYTEGHGSDAFRKSIVENFQGIAHLKDMDPDANVSVYLGATVLIAHWVELFIQSDADEAILFEPYYPIHFKGFSYKGSPKTSVLKFNLETGLFEFDWADIEAKLNNNTKVMILCNPNNPSARVASESEYQRLTELLDRFPQVKIIEDCAYAIYVSPGQKIRYFHEFGENWKKTITVFSAGKIFNTTGNRIGFSFTDPPLTKLMHTYLSDLNCPGATDQIFYGPSLKAALQPYQNYKSYWDYVSADIAHRVEYVRDCLGKLGVKTYESQGSYYLTMDAVLLSTKVDEKYYYTLGPDHVKESYRDRAVCRKLILKSGVGLVPFSGLTIRKPSPYDNLIRIPCNRSYKDLKLLIKSIRKIVEKDD